MRGKEHLTTLLARRAVELYVSGLSLQQVADELSGRCGAPVSRRWVGRRVTEAGVKRTRGEGNSLRVSLFGSHWSNSRERFAMQLEILRLAAAGVTWAAIADAVGCDRGTVRRTLREYGALRRDRRKVAA